MQSDFDGVSMRYSFDDAKADGARKTQFYSMLGSRGIWHEGWKAVTTHPTIAGWSHFNDDEWELYHTDVDRSELHDLAKENPDKLRELQNLWFAEAGRNGAFPLDDRSPLEIILTPRPAARAAAQPLHLLPRHGRRPGAAGRQRPQPLVRDRGAGRHPRPRRGGRAVRARSALRRARPLRQGQPAALRQQLRRHVRAEDRRDRGPADRREPDPLGRRSTRTARTRPASPPASLSLYHGEKKVGEGRIKTQPGVLLARRRGPVRRPRQRRGRHRRLPGRRRRTAFTGGTIKRVAVDVSGEPYVDLEREAQAMLSRE